MWALLNPAKFYTMVYETRIVLITMSKNKRRKKVISDFLKLF